MTDPSIAVAVPFAWTQGGAYDVRLEFASGTSPVDALVDNGTYRMNLAPNGDDFIRKVAAEITAALAAVGRAETCAASIGASGLVTLTLSGAADWTLTADLRDALGMASTTYAGVATVTGAYPPKHLYLFIGGDSGGWQRKEPIAASVTQAGTAFGVRSGVVTWTDEVALELIPADPESRAAASETATPWEAGSSTLPWSCATLIETALTKTCAFARHWQNVRASTSESYDLVTIRPDALSAPDAKYQCPPLTTWRQWTLPLVRTGTATRS